MRIDLSTYVDSVTITGKLMNKTEGHQVRYKTPQQGKPSQPFSK